MKTWLVLDCPFLCYRAWWVNKDMAWKGRDTGTIYGFLRSISALKDEFATDRVVFCFDHPHLYRRDIFPAYKEKRRGKEMEPEEEEAYDRFKGQIKRLGRDYLPRIGFKNIFRYKGMESDDIMAAIAQDMRKGEECILVTADSDMWQCLKTDSCKIYNPNKQQILTEESFTQQYGIIPPKWALVKAIAGCSTDGVPGIPGVGEITALKYMRDEFNKDNPVAPKIRPHWATIVNPNRRLVQLPYGGCPVPELQEDTIDEEGWRDVCEELGMRSIRSHPPIATRRAYATKRTTRTGGVLPGKVYLV